MNAAHDPEEEVPGEAAVAPGGAEPPDEELAEGGGEGAGERGEKPLGKSVLAAAYIPDFPLEEVRFWFAPSRGAPREVYHQFVGRSADKWETYFNRKGWRFIHVPPEENGAEGPFRPVPGELRIRLLDPGRFFAPTPVLRVDGKSLPIVGMEKRRPINPWKPNYIKALNFIKKYEWPHPVSSAVQSAVWEIEECGEIAGSTSWQNAELLLADSLTPEVRSALVDIFEKRPEEFPLGSEVYLRVLGKSGPDGFRQVCDEAKNPMWRKRTHVALAIGKLGDPRGIDTIFLLLDDEERDVRRTALRALGRIGIPATDPRAEGVRGRLEAEDIEDRVWAAQALLKGGDEAQRKFLINLVKEESERPLSDMGELGEVLAEMKIEDVVPFLINRLKSENSEVRADAAEALRGVTGLEVDFPREDEEGRRRAIRAYNRWWENRKKERRRERSEGG